MIEIFKEVGVEDKRDHMNTLRKLYSENETNVWATLERIKDHNSKKESEFIQSKFDAQE